jgi:hypothetical protein
MPLLGQQVPTAVETDEATTLLETLWPKKEGLTLIKWWGRDTLSHLIT